MSFWTDVELIFESIGKYVEPMLKEFMTDVGKAALSSATTVVAQVEKDLAGQAGAAKQQPAFQIIVADLAAMGFKTVETWLVNAAIETAVKFIGAGTTVAPASGTVTATAPATPTPANPTA